MRIPFGKYLISHTINAHFFIYEEECVNFLKYLINFFSTSFSSMLVENDFDLIVAKMFHIQLPLKKVFADLHFNLLYYMYIFFILY